MVKLTGPGLGARASGQLGQALIFSSNKGRAYVKKHARPKQPRSPAQVSLRAMMQFLSSQWSNIAPLEKSSWNAAAARQQISPFNAFQAYNLKRARNDQAPSKEFPARELPQYPDVSFWAATGGPRKIDLELTVTNPRNCWGFIYSPVSNTGVQPTWDQHLHISYVPGIGSIKWTWRGVTPGVYWIAFSHFTVTGLLYAAPIWRQATVTN